MNMHRETQLIEAFSWMFPWLLWRFYFTKIYRDWYVCLLKSILTSLKLLLVRTCEYAVG